MADSNRVVMFTDGACKGNPGPGGWAAVLRQNGEQRIVSGNNPHTTNNRMEMLAVIKGLEAAPLEKDTQIVIYSDSTYVTNTMTMGWKRKANHDLWERLDQAVKGRNITWEWVRGHNGTPGNELADSIARKEAEMAARDKAVPAQGAAAMQGKPAAPPKPPQIRRSASPD